jgi:hypothetical protein
VPEALLALSVTVTPKANGVPWKESGVVVAALVVDTVATGMTGPPLAPEVAANWAPPVAEPPGATPASAGMKPGALGGTGLTFQENDQFE